MKTNQIAWDKTNAAGTALISVQTPVKNKMGPQRDGGLKRYYGRQEGTEWTLQAMPMHFNTAV